MHFIDSEIQSYASRHTTPDPDLLVELAETTDREMEYSDMLSGPVVGRLLAVLINVSGARRVLEIGTFTGYSALTMAGALPPDGEVITCDVNEKYARVARSFFGRSEHGHKITLKMGEALDSLSRLKGPFDFVFMDADKLNYPVYYNEVLPKLRPGGLLVIDNVLWGGEVVDPASEKGVVIDRFNRAVAEDDRVEQVMLTVRDGLTIVRKL